MYARVARWEGSDAQRMRDTAARINGESGPPDGIAESSRFLMLIDPDAGTSLAIGLFETEEDRRQADEILNAMNPPGEGFGRRVGVEMMELAVEKP